MIAGDAAGITNSSWTLDLVTAYGETCTINWRTFRKWNEARVVLERHHDLRQSGEPLTFDDVSFDAAGPFGGFHMSS
jgi:transposase